MTWLVLSAVIALVVLSVASDSEVTITAEPGYTDGQIPANAPVTIKCTWTPPKRAADGDVLTDGGISVWSDDLYGPILDRDAPDSRIAFDLSPSEGWATFSIKEMTDADARNFSCWVSRVGHSPLMTLFVQVDGVWTAFSDWGVCSVACGGGTQSRERTCTNPAPAHGGADCIGELEESQACNEHPCPVDGGFTEFTVWTDCTETCGGGTQSRERTCTNPEPLHGGADCVGELSESQACNEDPCPVDGGWTDPAWSDCSLECGGGTQTRTKECTNPAPLHGGAECEGEADESQDCNSDPCPVDGVWTEFTVWSDCSLECGGGVVTRSRTCTNPAPAHGGAECVGELEESEPCNEDPCPVDGVWTVWTDWTPCSVDCAGGEQSRDRSCTNPEPAHGGADCEGEFEETQSCNTDPCPVDGVWTEFTVWSNCSAECDGGEQSRSRTCDPAPEHGGADCEGEAEETQACNTDACYTVVDPDKNDPENSCSTYSHTVSSVLFILYLLY